MSERTLNEKFADLALQLSRLVDDGAAVPETAGPGPDREDDGPAEGDERTEGRRERSRARRRRLVRTLGEVQGTIDSIRVGVQYLVFDLEATRRERDELRRRLIEEQRKHRD